MWHLRLQRVVLASAAAIPPVIVGTIVKRYGVNVPFADEWELVPLLKKASDGQLHWNVLWAQHNEHRLVLSRLILVILARATDWDIRYELLVNIVLAVGSFAIIAWLLWQTVHRIAPALTPWLLVVTSLLSFSLSQWQNWTWGWQIAIFLNMFAAVTTIWVVVRYGRSWRGFALGSLAATVGALSFANGLVLLLCVLPLGLLIVPPPDRHPGSLWLVVAAGVAGLGIAVLYVVGFRYPDHGPGLVRPALGTYLHFVVVTLGAGLGLGSLAVATFLGAVGLLISVSCGMHLWRSNPSWRPVLTPWALLAVYAILSSMMISFGRSGFGVEYALSSRYTTISLSFWISLAVLLAVSVVHQWRDPTISHGWRIAAVAVTASLTITAALAYSISSIASQSALRLQVDELQQGGACLRQYRAAADTCLNILYHDTAVVREHAEWLERMQLSVFTGARREANQRSGKILGP